MPERQTSSDAQGSDAQGSDAQGSDVTVSDMKVSDVKVSPPPGSPAVEPGETNGDGSGAARPTPAGAADGPPAPPLPATAAPSVPAPPEAESGTAGPPADDPPTEQIPAVTPPSRPRRRRALLLSGVAVVGLLVLLYAVDLVSSSGSVPRGVTVAGQEIGGLSHDEAEQRVRAVVEPRTTQPVGVAVGDVTSDIDPRSAGLAVDWSGTIDRAGSQSLNPFTRLRSFFTTREVGVATDVDTDALDSALAQLAPVVSKPPVEGTVRFEGVTPVPVPPVDGQDLDLPAAEADPRARVDQRRAGAPARAGRAADHDAGRRRQGGHRRRDAGGLGAGHGRR